MKTKLTYTFLAFFALLVFVPQANALPTTTTVAETEIQEKTFAESFNDFIDKRKQKRNARIMKVVLKVEKFAEKLDIDLDDDTNKWLWYAIFAWVASIILYILGAFTLGFLSWIGYLAGLIGSVCFVIWLLKYLDVM